MCKSNFCRWSSILLIVLTSSLLINPALAEPIQGPYVPGEVIIKYSDTATSGDINTLSSQLNFIRLREFSRIGASLERLTDQTVPEAIAQLENNPLVEYIEPNYLYTIDGIPNDPDFNNLWGMHNTGQTGGTVDADIDAPEAWNQFTGSNNVTVGVIDTGVDYNHPDLAANIWTNPGEIAGNGIDDDNNGFIDDIHGWDFVNNDNDPMDDHSHGTHCSGTIGGVGNNAVGVAGVNWNVKIMALKFLSAGGGGSSADAIGCIEYATMMGADLTSNSWGGGSFSTALEAAIQDAYTSGVLFVAAAGNSGDDNDVYPHYPSSYTTGNIVAVGATDHNDDRVVTGSWASCYGLTSVDIGAPGLDIYSTVLGNGYAYKGGTSMATPHVSGVLALVIGQYPGITVDAAQALIYNSADVLPQLSGLWVTGARINAAKALSGPDTIPPFPVVDLAVDTEASNWLSLSWTATGDDGDVGQASSYDIRYSTAPIDTTNFDTADQVADSPFPSPPGQTDTVTVDGLDFSTTYYFALKIRDEYGNSSEISNLATGTTLGIPVVSVTPTSLAASLITGEQQDQVLTLSNTGAGTLDFELSTVGADSAAQAMQTAAAAVVEGILPSGTATVDGETVTVLSPDELSLLRSRLYSYDQAGVNNPASVLPVIGVGGTTSGDMMYYLLANTELTGLYAFLEVDYEYDDLTQLEGLIIAEYDYAITEQKALVLSDFFGSGRPIMLGMDDFDDIWFGSIPGLLGPVFGISSPTDNDFCNNPQLNTAHPINDGIPGFVLGGYWCNENDSFSLDGADWLFQDSSQGYIFGVAHDARARTVCMGENLSGIWDANPQLNTNAVIWMMDGKGVPTVDPAFGTIAAGASLDITVTFDAEGICGGDYFGEVVIVSNDPVDPEVRVSTQMTVTGEPDIAVSPSLLDYGQVFIGAVVTDTLIVSNPGCDIVTVTAVAIDHPDFTTDLTPFDLQVGERRELLVEYSPSGAGPVSGALSLTSNDPDQPVLDVGLAAEGLVPPVIGVSPSSLSANLLTGEVDNQLLTIDNTGGSDLEFRITTEDLTAASGNVQVTSGRLLNSAPGQDAGADQGGAAWDEGATPLRDPLPAPVNTVPGTHATDLALLILGNGSFTEIQTQLMAFSDISVVDILDTDFGNPTLPDLLAYHAVILGNNSSFSDPYELGDLLADYVDQGGGVVQTVASFVGGFDLKGRFMDEGYSAFNLGTGPAGYGNLGSFDPAHPIMDGVSSAAGDLLATAPLATGAQWVADWDFGEAFVATQGTQVVGVNIFLAAAGYWSGDLPLVLHNAAAWSSGAARWLLVDPTEGTVAPGTSVDLLVTLDATGVCGGTYLGNIQVASNDPLTPGVAVPVEMIVTGEPDIAVSDTLLAYGQHFIGAVVPDTVMVSNPGCDLLQVTALSIDHGDFSVDVTPFDLLVGESLALEVFFSPTSVGTAAGTLSLTSNDPDTPVLTVDLTGEGVLAPEIVVTPTQLQANLLTGEVEVQQVTIDNTGGSDLVWSINAVSRDSLAALVGAAAAAAVEGLVPSGTLSGDDGPMTVLSETERSLFESRLATYRQTVAALGADEVLPLVGVSGYLSYDMMFILLNNPQLAGMFTFLEVYYEIDDLTALDGLVLAEYDYAINESKATVIRDFYDSGRGIFIGMDDFDDIWYPPVSDLLMPVLGISAPGDADFCSNAMLNPDHPINDGITSFYVGGSWCNDNDHFTLANADWLFMDSVAGRYFGVANDGIARTVTMGENLAGIWAANEQLNANALIWTMEGGSVPTVDPASGVIPSGGSQIVDVTFDASDLCGGNYYADLIIANNDPLLAELIVPADMHVTGETDIAVSDTLLAYGQVFMGAVVTDTVVVSNPGCDLLMVTGVSIDQGDFSTDTAPFNLQVGESRILEVAYSPGGLGPVAGTLSLVSNDPDEPLVTVALTGEGIAAPVIGVTPTQMTANLVTGESETQVLTIANTGGNDLVWEIQPVRRDSLAVLLRAAAAEVVAGIEPGETVNEGGGTYAVLSDADRSLIADRMVSYRQTVADLGADEIFPLVGVGGSYGFDLYYYLLNNPQLAGMYTFLVVDYINDDLAGLDGLAIADYYNTLTEAAAIVLQDFSNSGRGIFYGSDTVASAWTGNVPAILGPVFGISNAQGGDFCSNPQLNAVHPINEGIPGFNLGGDWCYYNNSFSLSTAQWLFQNGSTGEIFGVANQGSARTVMMGENLAWIWYPNEQLNANALIWVMDGAGIPLVDPAAGVVPAGGTQTVDVTFDATQLCGGVYLSDLVITNNDPTAREMIVPADMYVTGEPDIAVSDTLLAYGQQFIGAAIGDTVIVSNPGCDLLTVTGLAIDHADFSTDTTPFDLLVGEQKTLVVYYAPTSVGLAAGTLSLVSNDPDNPLLTVDLTGEGLLAPVVGVTPTQMSANLVTGEIETQVLTIANTGGNDLVWEISAVKRDSVAVLLQTAAAEAVAGIMPSDIREEDGESFAVLSDTERAQFEARLTAYRQTVDAMGIDSVPLIGVSGSYSYDMIYYLLSNVELTGMYSFVEIYYGTGDLSGLDGLILAEGDANISPDEAVAISDFYDSGRGILIGMDDFDSVWYPPVSDLLSPVFGMGGALDGDFCANAQLNPSHPITEGVPSFSLGSWCSENDHFSLAGADWLFRDSGTGWNFGIANQGSANTVAMGENLVYIWHSNLQLNVNAVIWMMEGAGLPQVEPSAGVVPVGGTQLVDVTFDATDLCGGDYLSNLVVTSNDPLVPEVLVPADMYVTGEPDIAVSDTLLAYGPQFIGAVIADTLVVSNPGCDLLTITALAIDHTDFSTDTTPFDLDVGEERMLVILYSPTSEGPAAGSLSLTSNDPDQALVTVDLTGEGVLAPVVGVTPTQLTANLLTGDIETQVLTIANTGGSDLVWEISASQRDSVTAAMRAAAAAVVAGIMPSGTFEADGVTRPVLSETEQSLMSDRMAVYRQTVESLGANPPLIGVSGFFGYDLLYYLLNNAELTGTYTFQYLNYAYDDLTALDGLVLAEYAYDFTLAGATILRDFHDSGRGVFVGMEAFSNIWSGSIAALLEPVFGISTASYGSFCSNPTLNTSHPINQGIPGFNLGGDWCYGNDSFVPTSADWLFMDGSSGLYYGMANQGAARSVLMGECLTWIWYPNEQLNVNAMIWVMGGTGLPVLAPESGVVPAGGSQVVDVTFDATDVCGGAYLSNLNIINNDPLAPVMTVQADMYVTGEPDIAVSDTLVAFGPVYIGATVADTVFVSNPGCDVLTVRPFMAVRIQEAGFDIDTTHFELQIGETHALEVTYSPTGVGPVTGEFTLASNDPNEPAVEVSLSGEGVTPPVIGVDPTSFDVTLFPGEFQTHALTIANTGGAALVWDISRTRRDSTAVAMQAAATAVVAGISPSATMVMDGATVPVLSEDEKDLMQARLATYQATAAGFSGLNALPAVGVGGVSNYDMLYLLLANPQLSALYAFSLVDYGTADLTQYDGLVVAESDGNISDLESIALQDFYDSGRGILLGMDDFVYIWSGPIATRLEAVFGVNSPMDADLCNNPSLNTTHPINQGIPVFNIGGWWCGDNDAFQMTNAEWLFKDAVQNRIFGAAHSGTANTVVMGENLIGIWTTNEQLNANALIWVMDGAGLPQVDPVSGVIPAGADQVVDVTFDATDVCGGDFYANLRVSSNDPLTPVIDVPADWHVLGVPIISLPDTVVPFGKVFVGETAVDTVVVANTGCGPLDVTSIIISHSDFTTDPTPFTVPVDGVHYLPVTFAPSAVSMVTGFLTLTSNDPSQPTAVVSLAGEGVDVPVVGVSPGQLASSLQQGETDTQMLTLSNTGAGELIYTIGMISSAGTSQAAVTVSSGRRLNPVLAGGDKSAPTAPSSTQVAVGFADGYDPLRPPYPIPAETVDVGNDFNLQLLMLGSGDLEEMQSQLQAFTDIGVVDIFDGQFATPTLAELMAYNVVILTNNYPWFDPVAVGNVVADYIDVGGGVIQTEASFSNGFNIAGRFMDEGYAVFGLDSGSFASAGLGTFDAAHPIMDGVTAVTCSQVSDGPLAPGAQWVADWSNGRTFVATNGDKVVGVNAFFAKSGRWTGDMDLVLHNAALWIGNRVSWLNVNPLAGTVPPGGSVNLMVTFNTTDLNAGQYSAIIQVGSNDPLTPLVSVPADLTVTGTLMTVEVDVAAGPATDLDNVLGMADGATDGFDGLFDLPEPPPAPADFVTGYFYHPEWGSPLGDRFMTDIRATYDPGTAMKSWPFVVETDLGDTVTLDFTPSFQETTGWQLWLRDESTGGMHNLFPSLTYTFVPEPGANAFTIFVGNIVPPLDPPLRQIASGWSMLGVPLVPPVGSDTWADVLLDDTAGTTYLFDYQGATGYGDVAGGDPVNQGQGVWLASTDNFAWTMSGDPDDGTIDVPAMVGWNLVGYPLWIGGSLDGVSVEYNGQLYLWQNAVAMGLVSPFVFDYDGGLDTYLAVTTLEPWRGYWMAAHVSGVTLQFNYRSMLGITHPSASAAEPGGGLPLLVQASSASGDKAEVEKTGGTDWQMNIGLASIPDQVAIGQAADATSGFDAVYDLPVPPSSPSSTEKTTLVIRHPEWNLACGSGFYSDVTALEGDLQQWSLTVSTPEPGSVSLYWDPLDLPAGVELQVYLPHENRVAVMSVRDESGVVIEVGSSPVQVQFRTPDAMSDVPGQVVGLQLRNAPNPFNPMTEFRFNLPRQGNAEIRIFDIRGAVVRRVSGGVMPAGAASLRWAGRDEGDRQVASGIYFYRLYLDGKQEGPTIKMTLVK